MSLKITDDCVACGDCSVVCPEGAIADSFLYNTLGEATPPTNAAGDGAMLEAPERMAGFYQITDTCTECGRCMEVCPAGAIREL